MVRRIAGVSRRFNSFIRRFFSGPLPGIVCAALLDTLRAREVYLARKAERLDPNCFDSYGRNRLSALPVLYQRRCFHFQPGRKKLLESPLQLSLDHRLPGDQGLLRRSVMDLPVGAPGIFCFHTSSLARAGLWLEPHSIALSSFRGDLSHVLVELSLRGHQPAAFAAALFADSLPYFRHFRYLGEKEALPSMVLRVISHLLHMFYRLVYLQPVGRLK